MIYCVCLNKYKARQMDVMDSYAFMKKSAETQKEVQIQTELFVQQIRSLEMNDIENLYKIVHAIQNYYEYLGEDNKDSFIRPMTAKNIFNDNLGWTIPSWMILQTLQNLQNDVLLPIYDLGSGRGLLLHLLKCLGCNVCGVDVLEKTHEGDIKILPIREADIIYDGNDTDIIPINSILLICWGSECYVQLQSYIHRGGKYVVIIGESCMGCTLPADLFMNDKFKGWKTTMINIPNFLGMRTFMTVNIKV